jgi:hypothetical protein
MKKPTPIKKSEFDLKCTLIIANRKLSLDDKAKAILKLRKKNIINNNK